MRIAIAARDVRMALVMMALCAVWACGRGPRSIAYGQDTCAFCLMQITDARYGAELVTRTGKVYTFDSIECLVGYYQSLNPKDSAGVESMWVSDYVHPNTLIPASSAAFLRVSGPGSPMGGGMLAVAHAADLAAVRGRGAAAELKWVDVLALGRRERWSGDKAGSDRTIGDAIRRARSGDTIHVRAGVYREPTIVVDRPVTLIGDGRPTLDGQGTHQIMRVTADDVTIRGLRFAHVGTTYTEDRAAITTVGVHGCTIEDNEIDDAFFGIYLNNTTDCVVRGNTIRGLAVRETSSGNGIHLWSSRHIEVADNRVSGQRDGIYLEFTHNADVHGNISEHNLRYGLHFMYSDDCWYRDNTFRQNGAGVAVMFAHRITMTGNRFVDNWGSTAYGLLLKEIFDGHVAHNLFQRNTTGLKIDGANRLQADSNVFNENGWALTLDGSTQDARFTANNFRANTFDVGATGRTLSTTMRGNYWDAYNGYDLNRDGVGDVPYQPVRLFSAIVQRNPPAMILLRSAFADLVDIGERVVPTLTPVAFVDSAPRMREVR